MSDHYYVRHHGDTQWYRVYANSADEAAFIVEGEAVTKEERISQADLPFDRERIEWFSLAPVPTDVFREDGHLFAQEHRTARSCFPRLCNALRNAIGECNQLTRFPDIEPDVDRDKLAELTETLTSAYDEARQMQEQRRADNDG